MRILLKPALSRVNSVTRFNFTGAIEYYTVPLNTYLLTLKLWSGGGGINSNFKGGSSAFVSGDLEVFPQEQLIIYVGQAGGDAIGNGNAGGGGGATAILRGSTVLAIAGAGSGAMWNTDYSPSGRLISGTNITTTNDGGDGGTYGAYPSIGGWGYGHGGKGGGSGIVGGAGGGGGHKGGKGGPGANYNPGYGGTSDWSGLINPVCEAGADSLPGGSLDLYKESFVGNYAQNGQLVIVHR